MPAKPVPTQKETEFRIQELFFSTTDRKGIIGFGNDVFTRISGYKAEELVGAPHSLVRHPDMPSGVFELVWEYLKQGKRAVGYVKNMAADGSYYWVCAAITPISGGYLSIRLKPTSGLFPVVQEVYKKMRVLELAAKEDGLTLAEGMKKSRAYLEEAVRGAGFADYDGLMQAIILHEVRGRKERLGVVAGTDAGSEEKCRAMRMEVSQMFDKLGAIGSLEESLGKEMAFIQKLGAELHLISLNAQVRTAGLQEEGRTLQTVAQQMSRIARSIAGSTDDVCRRMRSMMQELTAAASEIAMSDLSVEMVRLFVREARGEGATFGPCVEALAEVIRHTLDLAGRSVREVAREMEMLAQVLANFMKEIRALEIVHVTGKVEAVRSEESRTVSAIFDEVTIKAREARKKLVRITELADLAAVQEPNREAIERNLRALAV